MQTGTRVKPGPKPRPIEERFWSKTEADTNGGCVLWAGASSDGRYGLFCMPDRTKELSHRVAWSLKNGPIPDGLNICHSCDVTLCVNDAHLFPGTQKENLDDMRAKGRGPDRKHEAHPQAKLTWEDVGRMRALHAAGAKYVELSEEFGVVPWHVSQICRNVAWVQ